VDGCTQRIKVGNRQLSHQIRGSSAQALVPCQFSFLRVTSVHRGHYQNACSNPVGPASTCKGRYLNATHFSLLACASAKIGLFHSILGVTGAHEHEPTSSNSNIIHGQLVSIERRVCGDPWLSITSTLCHISHHVSHWFMLDPHINSIELRPLGPHITRQFVS
jgi:hypothetical protein